MYVIEKYDATRSPETRKEESSVKKSFLEDLHGPATNFALTSSVFVLVLMEIIRSHNLRSSTSMYAV